MQAFHYINGGAVVKAFRKNAVKKKVRKNKTKATYTLQKNTTYYIRIRYVGKD